MDILTRRMTAVAVATLSTALATISAIAPTVGQQQVGQQQVQPGSQPSPETSSPGIAPASPAPVSSPSSGQIDVPPPGVTPVLPAPVSPTPVSPASPSPSPTPLTPAPGTASPSPGTPAPPEITPSSPSPSPASFSQQEVDQSRFIAVAAPYAGGTAHQLLILEQVKDTQPCWSVSGGGPAIVDPLLRGFDFTGICGRSIDANGYSIRVNGQDLAKQYTVRIVRRNQDLVLVGDPLGCYNPDRSKCPNPEFEIGHAYGITPDFAEIRLNPGWRFTRRVLGDRPLGHIYLTYEGTFPPEAIAVVPGTTPPPVTPTPNPATLTFRDIGGDVYAQEIQQAVQLGFIAGFEDGSFRPQRSLTREQLVSMALESLKRVPGVNLVLPTTTDTSPYSDVEASRWSAAKIAFAQRNNIVSGYEDGTFRPNQPVTRAEMMAILKRTAEYGRSLRRLPSALPPTTQAPKPFSDIAGHWAEPLINQMSTYCNVASSLNEAGTNFAPNVEAQRNYAAAATLRMFNCVANAQ